MPWSWRSLETYQQDNLWMAQKSKMKVLQWPSESLDLYQIKMRDFKQAVHAQKPSDVAELK